MNGHPDIPRLPWRDPLASETPPLQRTLCFVLVAAAHVALIFLVLELATNRELQVATRELVVRLVEPTPPPVVDKPPRPLPTAKQETVPRLAPPPPVMTAATEAPLAPAFAVAPQPPAPVALPPIQAAPVAAPVVTGARFDADYLHNPKPVYPIFSRRQNEEGKVQLRVRVSSEGAALEVEIRQSSGFPRLDAAAREAVLKWRFVPARRGDEAIESWVGVPIVFALEN